MLDVATGAGDIPRALLQIGRRQHGVAYRSNCRFATSIPRAIEFARQQAEAAAAPIEFFQCDVLKDDFPAGFDAVVCTLFMHHLSDAEAAELMRRMAAAARRLAVVCDLARSKLAWWLTYAGTRLLTRSPVVHVDGPLSVQAAFTMDEIRVLAAEAGLADCQIRRGQPFRFVLSWWRHANDNSELPRA